MTLVSLTIAISSRSRFQRALPIKIFNRGMSATGSKCIFCKIAAKEAPAKILLEDEKFVVFPDRSPAAEHHFLVIPKIHIKSVQSLTKHDIDMVKEMEEAGLKVLQEQGGSQETVMTGFHWPIHTVSHLHMHVISPSDNMRFLKRAEFSRFFFGSTQQAIEMLEKQ